MINSPLPNELRARINSETGKISWQELQPHYARGVVIHIEQDLDLVDVALRLAEDDKASFEQWLCAGSVARADEQLARDWAERSPNFWAVVIAPWVLVQEVDEGMTVN